MIVRSMQHAGEPGDEERRGNGDQNRDADVAAASQLHDVGGVGAEHHQLAVRHVDDAHDAERDRQPDRHQHQHRSEAQAEEQRLDARVERCARRSMLRPPSAAAARDRRVGFGEACRPATFSSSAASRLRTSGLSRSRQRRDRLAAAPAGSPPSSAASASPVSISRLHAGVGFAPARARAAARRSRRRASAACPGPRPAAPRHPGSPARSARPSSAGPAAGGCWCRSWSARPRRRMPASLRATRDRSSSNAASVVVGRLDDERPSGRRCGSTADPREAR